MDIIAVVIHGCVCLCSAVDVSAAENVGRVLAQRCLQAGITCMLLEPLSNSDKSEKVRCFLCISVYLSRLTL